MFCHDLGNDDEVYFVKPVRRFEEADLVATTLPVSYREALLDRLDRVRGVIQNFVCGVGDDPSRPLGTAVMLK